LAGWRESYFNCRFVAHDWLYNQCHSV
jgi:hypothetical protein